MSVPLKRHHFNVAEYYRMAEAGILKEDDRVELIEGDLIEMSPIGSRHASCVATLTELLVERMRGEAFVWSQNPVTLSDFSEPQPDVALLRRRDDRYRKSHPTPDDVLLLVEVAETTAAYDKRVKVPLYARSGIGEVWIVDLVQERIEIHSQPSGGSYQRLAVFARGESFASVTIPGLVVAAEDILG